MDMAEYTLDQGSLDEDGVFGECLICKCIRVTFFIMLLVLIPSWYNQKYVFESIFKYAITCVRINRLRLS